MKYVSSSGAMVVAALMVIGLTGCMASPGEAAPTPTATEAAQPATPHPADQDPATKEQDDATKIAVFCGGIEVITGVTSRLVQTAVPYDDGRWDAATDAWEHMIFDSSLPAASAMNTILEAAKDQDTFWENQEVANAMIDVTAMCSEAGFAMRSYGVGG